MVVIISIEERQISELSENGAQFGRATRLHVRQCFFKGAYYAMNIIDLIAKSMSYFIDSRE
jgi:hypothetical protein